MIPLFVFSLYATVTVWSHNSALTVSTPSSELRFLTILSMHPLHFILLTSILSFVILFKCTEEQTTCEQSVNTRIHRTGSNGTGARCATNIVPVQPSCQSPEQGSGNGQSLFFYVCKNIQFLTLSNAVLTGLSDLG